MIIFKHNFIRESKTNGTHLGVDGSNLFDSAAFTRAAMFGSDYTPIGSLTEFFNTLVFRIDHKSGVEGLERVSLHN